MSVNRKKPSKINMLRLAKFLASRSVRGYGFSQQEHKKVRPSVMKRSGVLKNPTHVSRFDGGMAV